MAQRSRQIRTSNEDFYRLFHQATDDMATLRLPVEQRDQIEFVPAAGLPWFVALFGRDSLIASIENALVYPEFAQASLDMLGAYQGASATIIAMPSPARSCTS